MKKKVIFLDFFGTLVQEDNKAIPSIVESISRDSKDNVPKHEVYKYWAAVFAKLLAESYGENFKPQREISLLSLKNTLNHFDSKGDPVELCEPLFEHWTKPRLFEDSKMFLDSLNLPVCIVSNIDSTDLYKAIDYNHLQFKYVITSEDARSYKPRPEIFKLALKEMSVTPDEVIHIGDSLTSDILGAQQMGITAAWINRRQREAGKVAPDLECRNFTDLLESDYFKH